MNGVLKVYDGAEWLSVPNLIAHRHEIADVDGLQNALDAAGTGSTGVIPQPCLYKSNEWTMASVPGMRLTAGSFGGAGRLGLTRFVVTKQISINAIAVNVTAAAAVGTTMRYFLYDPLLNTFSFTSGTVASDVLGLQAATVAWTIPPKEYWVGVHFIDGNPSISLLVGSAGFSVPTANVVQETAGLYKLAGASLPATLADATPFTVAPRIWVRSV